MKDLTSATKFELCQRMNQINQEINQLQIEYNRIIAELHNRLPHLKDDVDIQPKVLRKTRRINE